MAARKYVSLLLGKTIFEHLLQIKSKQKSDKWKYITANWFVKLLKEFRKKEH